MYNAREARAYYAEPSEKNEALWDTVHCAYVTMVARPVEKAN